jgi:hypothetical protein
MSSNSIPQTILTMAAERAPDKTVCPSEIARAMFPDDWRKHMQKVRDAAVVLQKNGKVVITQKGKPVDVEHIKGPIRIKLNSLGS